MSATITITGVNLGGTPIVNQQVTVEYRICDSGPYTLVTSTQVVLPDGSFSPILNITPVTEGTCYDVKITNNCGGPAIVKQVTTASTACPDIEDFESTTEIEP